MEIDRRWPVIGICIAFMIIAYLFVSIMFKSNQKKLTHDRMFVDYSEYNPQKSDGLSYSYSSSSRHHPNEYVSAQRVQEIKRTVFKNAMTATLVSYNEYMQRALKGKKESGEALPKPVNSPQYEQYLALANKSVPKIQSALYNYGTGDYDYAIKLYTEALSELDQMDVKHRIDIYGMLAECYLKLKNDDGYIQNKVRQIRMERRLKKILQTAFPGRADRVKVFSWPSTQEASKHLLRMRSLSARSSSAVSREMLKRAELDLEVARVVGS